MLHKELGADSPRSLRAAWIATNVFEGNFDLRQLKAAPYVRPVSLATALVPPRASMTSSVVVSMETIHKPDFLDMQGSNDG